MTVPASWEFRGLWIEPLDGQTYRWRCRRPSCTWDLEQNHGDNIVEALDAYLNHRSQCPREEDSGDYLPGPSAFDEWCRRNEILSSLEESRPPGIVVITNEVRPAGSPTAWGEL